MTFRVMEKNLENCIRKTDASERHIRETRRDALLFLTEEEETNEALRESRTTVNSLS